MTSTDVGVSTPSSFRESESSNLATVPRIMYRSLQQTTIPAAASRAGGVTNDRIPLQRLNDDEYDEVNLGGGGGGEAADLDSSEGQRELKKRSKKKRKRKLSEKAPSSILDEK